MTDGREAIAVGGSQAGLWVAAVISQVGLARHLVVQLIEDAAKIPVTGNAPSNSTSPSRPGRDRACIDTSATTSTTPESSRTSRALAITL
jgi:hypothetical protein